MTVWKGTWKPDGTGGWHTKSDKDIVDQYNSARLTPAPAQMLKDAIDEVVRLREENGKLREELITSSKKYYDIGYACAKDMAKDVKDEVELLRKEITKIQKESVKQRFALIEIQCKAHDILRPVPFQEEDDEV
jgi:hypothetical protein